MGNQRRERKCVDREWFGMESGIIWSRNSRRSTICNCSTIGSHRGGPESEGLNLLPKALCVAHCQLSQYVRSLSTFDVLFCSDTVVVFSKRKLNHHRNMIQS